MSVEEAKDRSRWRALVGKAKSWLGHKWPVSKRVSKRVNNKLVWFLSNNY